MAYERCVDARREHVTGFKRTDGLSWPFAPPVLALRGNVVRCERPRAGATLVRTAVMYGWTSLAGRLMKRYH